MEKHEDILRLEHALMETLLKNSHQIPEILLEQWKLSTISKIEVTGAGFFINYRVPTHAPVLRDSLNFTVGNIGAKIPGLRHGAGFVLFVKNGVISKLEGYSYEEPWPNKVESFELFETGNRD